MPTNLYVPAFCSDCVRIHLCSVAPGDVPSCRNCGAATTILPGAAYAAEDVELFEQLDLAVRSDLISEQTGRRLGRELLVAGAMAAGAERTLLLLIDDLPRLQFLLPALRLKPTSEQDRALMARALGMIQMILNARTSLLEHSA